MKDYLKISRELLKDYEDYAASKERQRILHILESHRGYFQGFLPEVYNNLINKVSKGDSNE